MEKLPILSASPLFEMLSPQELENVAELSRPRRYSVGQIIFEEGELGDSLYVIATGEVEVLRRNSSGDQKPIAVLQAAEFLKQEPF